jgi:hypothetical protein
LRWAPGDPEASAALATARAIAPYFEAIDAVPGVVWPEYQEVVVSQTEANTNVRAFVRVDDAGREVARLVVRLELDGATARVRLETLGPVPETVLRAASSAIEAGLAAP